MNFSMHPSRYINLFIFLGTPGSRNNFSPFSFLGTRAISSARAGTVPLNATVVQHRCDPDTWTPQKSRPHTCRILISYISALHRTGKLRIGDWWVSGGPHLRLMEVGPSLSRLIIVSVRLRSRSKPPASDYYYFFGKLQILGDFIFLYFYIL